MEGRHSLCGLIIFLCFLGPSLQEETTEAPAASVETTPPAASEAPKDEPKSENQAVSSAPGADSPPGAGSPPGTESPPAAGSPPGAGASPAGGGQCKPNEVLSDNGCVPKEDFLEKVVMESWKDEGFKKEKETIGVVDGTKCKANEVKTPYGCSEPKDKGFGMARRVRVLHSSLDTEQIVHSNYGKGAGRSQSEDAPRHLGPYKGPPFSAHNRPRKHYILPGRRLRSDRICRPYEVLQKDGKCVRKKGKTGLYKHKDHVYGLQDRHRHGVD